MMKVIYRVKPDNGQYNWFFDKDEAELWMAEYADSMDDGQTIEFAEVHLEWAPWLSLMRESDIEEALFSHQVAFPVGKTHSAKDLKGTA